MIYVRTLQLQAGHGRRVPHGVAPRLEESGDPRDVHIVSTAELGDRSYVVAEGGVAVVVDPQRDTDRIEQILDDHALVCAVVVETHIHNDYVTGGYHLARRRGARYVVNADDPVEFERVAVSDGDEFEAGPLRITVISTPGHTYSHLSYLVRGADPEATPAIFTGGSLLFGSVGRTDLLGSDHTADLTHQQYHSARRLAALLPDEVPVYPTHGFGSFCSSGSTSGGDHSTIGEERRRNDALTTADEDTFVTTLIDNLAAYPAYYAHMAAHNLAGPEQPDLSPPVEIDAHELRHRIDHGEWVVDLRDRSAYASGHLVGTIGIPLSTQFSTYLGWLIPWGSPLTLIGERAEDVADAQRQLVRIGIDELDGAATGTVENLAAGRTLGHYRETTFADPEFEAGSGLRDPGRPGRVVLDVRRDDERAKGGIAGSTHVPLHQLLNRLGDLPDGELWVHCASGFRASIASSLIARAGRDVVYVNDEYARAVDAGLTTERPDD